MRLVKTDMNNKNQIICPLCNDSIDKLLYRFHIDSEKVIIEKIKNDHPLWATHDGLCSRCLDYYHTEIVMGQRILPQIGPYFPVKTVDDFVILPTGVRLDADPKYTGKNVTICFVDSGFCEHPDLSVSKKRVRLIVDLTGDQDTTDEPDEKSLWHGTMTSVICAGDGYLSKGLYRGIASDASLVLLKVQDKNGKIGTENIIKALKWIVENHRQYNIRVVNLSLRDDEATSYKENKVDQLAEQLISEGVTVVAAVGNDDNGHVYAPANSLNVIAVGGIDDNNRIEEEKAAYHSTYGKTTDGLMKPELVAHAIWIAAPILPNSAEQKEAKVLFDMVASDDISLLHVLKDNFSITKLDISILHEKSPDEIRNAIRKRIREAKYISPHYMHVDGTSFAAPIVTSVIAQLLELQPALKPDQIRQLLFSSAKRLPGIATARQGFGVIQPRKAVLKILKRAVISPGQKSPAINRLQKTIAFYLQHEAAAQISLAGDFNNWAEDILLMEPCHDGIWKIEIPLLPAGKYQYKFFVDSSTWIEDVSNPYREADGYDGFNSILIVEPGLN